LFAFHDKCFFHFSEFNQDISVLMRLRALDGYGFSLEKNEHVANAHADSRFDVTKLSAFWRHFQRL
jgi:hypothetical protein